MGRKLKALAALGGIVAAQKCRDDGHRGGAAFFGAIGLAATYSLANELEEEEAAEQEAERIEELHQERIQRRLDEAAVQRWREEHICSDCSHEFDELHSRGMCYRCWARWDNNMDYDD